MDEFFPIFHVLEEFLKQSAQLGLRKTFKTNENKLFFIQLFVMAIETVATEIPWYLTEKFRATDRQPMALRMNDRLKHKVTWL